MNEVVVVGSGIGGLTAAITAAGRTGAGPGATGWDGFSGTRDTVAKQTPSDGGRPQVPMG